MLVKRAEIRGGGGGVQAERGKRGGIKEESRVNKDLRVREWEGGGSVSL